MEPEVQRDKLDWADALRSFAACSVIFLHVAVTGVLTYSPSSLNSWWVCNIYDSAVRSCVPLFVMLTGALVLPSERPLLAYLKKRVTRVVYPLLFWSLVYLVYYYCYLIHDGDALGGLTPTIKWAYGKMQIGAAFHFWYIYMVLGLYLFIPVIGRWVRTATDQEILYFLAIWAVTLFGNYPAIAKYGIRIDLGHFSGYLGYLVAGYYLATREVRIRKWFVLAALGTGYLITVIGTYYLARKNGQFIETFYNPLTPHVALMALAIFYMFRHASLRPITGLLAIIQQNSYNIYLAHVLVLLVLARWGISEFIISPILGVPLLSLVCLASCTLIALGIRKSFLGKYIAG